MENCYGNVTAIAIEILEDLQKKPCYQKSPATEKLNCHLTRDRLVVYKDPDSGLLVCGGRVQIFKEDVTEKATEDWLKLLRMRRKACVIRGRRIAQKFIHFFVGKLKCN